MKRSLFDSIVILSASNWFTELRSNRYHYATRFAREFNVLFVQPDLYEPIYSVEDTEFAGLKVLHVWKHYDQKQIELLNEALLKIGARKPAFWIYNGQFTRFLEAREAALKVYHATEDYFSADSYIVTPARVKQALHHTLQQCHLLICVSDGVAQSYQENSAFVGQSVTITNGCDYAFYAPRSLPDFLSQPKPTQSPIIFYQGNIFDKLDYALLIDLANRMPDWQFQFCGRVLFNEKGWKRLCRLPNVTYLGVLSPEDLRAAAYQATVGMIPFVETPFLLERSFPLKAFEYLACGLPVVTVPIQALQPFKAVMQFASGADAFVRELKQAKTARYDAAQCEARLVAARGQDYEEKVQTVLVLMTELSADLSAATTSVVKNAFTKNRVQHTIWTTSLFQAMGTCIKHSLLALYAKVPQTLHQKIPAGWKRSLMKRFFG